MLSSRKLFTASIMGDITVYPKNTVSYSLPVNSIRGRPALRDEISRGNRDLFRMPLFEIDLTLIYPDSLIYAFVNWVDLNIVVKS